MTQRRDPKLREQIGRVRMMAREKRDEAEYFKSFGDYEWCEEDLDAKALFAAARALEKMR